MEENWNIVIKSQNKLLDINLKELIKYKDLIYLFVKRNFSAQYKQTILGPLWFVLNPLITTVMYTIVFGGIAGFATNGVPKFAFYLCSTAIWQYFATCLNNTSNTFTSNAAIFGKVYFPRLTVPIATVIFSLINFTVVFCVAIIDVLIHIKLGDISPITWYILLVPILVSQTAILGLGFGIIISSLTTKYRDLTVLVSFGVQLWMYATPVVYSLEDVSPKLEKILLINPMTPVVTNFRYAVLGCGHIEWRYWGISWIVTVVILLIGVILFNKVEKTFMDTV